MMKLSSYRSFTSWVDWLANRLFQRFTRSATVRSIGQNPFQLDALEPRQLLSGTTYVVDSLQDSIADDGVTTLREAIAASNTNTILHESPSMGEIPAGSSTEVDTITFDASIFTNDVATITLDGAELEITDDLTITVDSAKTLTIDADDESRVFSVTGQDTTVTFNNLVITGGDIDEEGGAGIYVGDGAENHPVILNINDSIVTGNNAGETYTEIEYVNGVPGPEHTIYDGADGGGLFLDWYAEVTINDSVVSSNLAGSGGGIYDTRQSTKLVIENSSSIENNTAYDQGGGMFIDSKHSEHTVIISESVVQHNTAFSISYESFFPTPGEGGGITNYGDLQINDSEIKGNSAEGYGGGISQLSDAGTVTLNYSIISSNYASKSGGGISGVELGIILNNSVIVGNYAAEDGGGIYGVSADLYNSVITHNTAVEDGSGVYVWEEMDLYNSILSLNNNNDDIYYEGVGTGYNADHSLVGIDPVFVSNPDPGADGWGDDPDTTGVDESANDDYGDLRLQSTSPAINAGENSLLPNDVADIDGDTITAEPIPYDLSPSNQPRVVECNVDIGAYEYQSLLGAPEINSVTLSDYELTFGETATVTIEFSESVAGLDVTDFDAPNGSISNVVDEDGDTWTAVYTPDHDVNVSTNVITVIRDGIEDANGNPVCMDHVSSNFTIDTVANPVATITPISDTTSAITSIVVTFSEPIEYFEDEAIQLYQNATTEFDFSNASFTPNGDRTVWTITDSTPTTGLDDFTAIKGHYAVRVLDSIYLQDYAGFQLEEDTDFEEWTNSSASPSAGDVNRDGTINADDIDQMKPAIDLGFSHSVYQLDGDSDLDVDDRTYLIENILATKNGDLNLDGKVNIQDLARLAANFNATSAGWNIGDINADTIVNIDDLAALAANFGFNSSNAESMSELIEEVDEGSPNLDYDVDQDLDVDDDDVDEAYDLLGFEWGDLDFDGDIDADDIDLISDAVNTSSTDLLYDLDRDNDVDSDDRIYLIETILDTHEGDTDLDGVVTMLDYATVAGNYDMDPAGWADGDVSGDGEVGIADLAKIGANISPNDTEFTSTHTADDLTFSLDTGTSVGGGLTQYQLNLETTSVVDIAGLELDITVSGSDIMSQQQPLSQGTVFTDYNAYYDYDPGADLDLDSQWLFSTSADLAGHYGTESSSLLGGQFLLDSSVYFDDRDIAQLVVTTDATISIVGRVIYADGTIRFVDITL